MIFTDTIKRNGDFTRVYKNGRHYTGKNLILYVLKGVQDKNALGVTASKKAGNSVRRNRLKRLVKENYRLFEHCVPAGYLFVFVIRSQNENGNMPGFSDIRHDMKALLNRAGVFDRQKWEISCNGA